MMEMVELKPCPICKGEKKKWSKKTIDVAYRPLVEELTVGGFRTGCYGCCNFVHDVSWTREQSIESWNELPRE